MTSFNRYESMITLSIDLGIYQGTINITCNVQRLLDYIKQIRITTGTSNILASSIYKFIEDVILTNLKLIL